MTLTEGLIVRNADTAALFRREANNIFNTKLFVFQTVQTGNYKPGPSDTGLGTADIYVNVKERWYTWPYPILELADRNFNEWYYNRHHDWHRINYGAFVTQNNLTGDKDPLKVRLQTGFSNKIELSYAMPYINAKLNEGLRLSVSYQTQTNLAVSTLYDTLHFINFADNRVLRTKYNASLGYTLRRGLYKTHTLDLDYNQSSIADTLAKLNPRYFLDGATRQRYSQLEYNYLLDRRNIRQYALKGFYFNLQLQQLGLLPGEDVFISSTRIVYARYHTLGHNFSFAWRADVGLSTPRRQPYSNWRALGFTNRIIRGYDRYVLEGPQTFLLKNSLRKRVFSRVIDLPLVGLKQFKRMPLDIYLKTYADAGYVRNDLVLPQNTLLINTPLIGGGLGLDIVTFYDAVIRLEYSYNKLGERNFFFYLTTDI